MSNDTISNHPPESSTSAQHNHHTLPVAFILILLVFFSIGFFSIYFSRCIIEYITGGTGLIRHSPTGNTARNTGSNAHGLDPSIVSSFPTFVYSTVKDHRQEKSNSLECAVCLSEFEDDDVLRLLTLCNHAFHFECIDLWLGLHTTCPVCRQNLDPSQKSPEKSQEVSITILDSVEGGNETSDDRERRNSDDEDEEERRIRDASVPDDSQGRLGGHGMTQRFSRSHSTGHSIVEGDDRFTLRLPEHVKERITRGHNFTGSCITFGDFSGGVTPEKNGVDQGEFIGVSGEDVVTRV